MDAQPLFTGLGVALVTLFDDDLAVDVEATAAHAERLVDIGVRAVLVAGSTGEAAALDADERTALVGAVRSAVPSSVSVIAGTGAPSGRQASALTARAVDAGADAVLALSPPRSPDPRPYYEAVAAAAGDVPVLAYSFPQTSPPGIALEHLADLPVQGMKDSSGDGTRLVHLVATWDRPVWVGAAGLLLHAHALGVAGAILALANAEPERCAAALEGDAEAQVALSGAIAEAAAAFPAGVKQLAARRFGTSTAARL